MKRLVDFLISLLAIAVFSIPMFIIACAIRLSSTGPALYWSKRVGRDNELFMMPKFRTMRIETPTIATHLLQNPESHITPLGRILRKTSLDELPQLWCILKGEMSIVGPRPALFNQTDLIKERTIAGVHILKPGLTGWAQVNGRDELEIPAKVAFDAEYAKKQSLVFDLWIVLLTVQKVLNAKGVSH